MSSKKTSFISSRQLVVLLSCGAVIVISLFAWWRFSSWATIQSNELAAAETQSVSDFFLTFGNQGLIPIVRPGAQEIGSVYNASTGRWIYESSTCFPNLRPKPQVGSALPSVALSRAQDTSIALGFDKVLSVLVGSKQIKSVKLSFSNVTVQDTPEHLLRETYSSKNCPELQAIMDSVSSGEPPKIRIEPLLILGTLYRAKRIVTIELNNNVAASEALDAVKRSVPVKGNMSSGAGGTFSITIENDATLPVAAAPAFIPTPTGLTLSPGQPNTRIVWMPFDPALNSDQIKLFKQLTRPTTSPP